MSFKGQFRVIIKFINDCQSLHMRQTVLNSGGQLIMSLSTCRRNDTETFRRDFWRNDSKYSLSIFTIRDKTLLIPHRGNSLVTADQAVQIGKRK